MTPTHAAFTSFVTHLPIFGRFYAGKMSTEECDRVIQASQRLKYEKDAVVISHGDRRMDRYAYLLIAGEVDIVSPEGKSLSHQGPYTYFGVRGIVKDEVPTSSVLALTSLQVYRVPDSVLLSLPAALLQELQLETEQVLV